MRSTATQLFNVALFTASFLSLVVASALAWRLTPLGERRMDIADASRPRAHQAYYLAHDRGGQVDHHVLYHGTDRLAIERLERAEVLFLGNSRLMFALPRPELRRFFFDHHLSYYMLGFGHDEENEFPQALVEKYDLRPKLVIVNADGFFGGGQSDWAEKVMSETYFDAIKLQYEAEAAHAVRQLIHQVVPHWIDLLNGQREFIIHRSRFDGSWFVGTNFGDGSSFQEAADDGELDVEGRFRRAAAFKADMDRRGAKLILCYVTNPREPRYPAEILARRLNVPLIAPRLDGLRTMDASHLTEASAERFGAAFLAELDRVLSLPAYRDIGRASTTGQ